MSGSRTVRLEILGDGRSAQKALEAVGQSSDGLGSKLATFGKVAAAGLAVAGAAAGALAVSGVMAASDLSESMSKVDVVFGDSASRIHQFGENAAQAFGLSRSEALASLGTFGNLFVAMDMSTEAAADMSEGIVGLAADLGSFNNMGTDEVLEKLRAGLTGETEPLKSLGINLNAAAIEAKALEMGLADVTGELSPAAKAQATYALILEQTATAQGDFARTKDGMANSLKVISASFEDLRAEIGMRLLPAIEPLISGLASNLPRALDLATTGLDSLSEIISPQVRAFRDLALAVGGGLLSAFEAIRPLLGDIVTVLGGPVGAALKGAIQGFGKDGLAGILPGAVGGLENFVEAIGRLGRVALDALGQVDWAGLASRLLDGLLGAVEMVSDAGSRIANWLVGQFQSIDWSGLATSFVNGLLAGVEMVADFGSRMLGWISGQLASVDWSSLATTVVNGLIDGINAVVDFGTRFATWAIGQFEAIDWSGVGQSILNGIVAGFQAASDFGSQIATFLSGAIGGADLSGPAQSIATNLGTALGAVDWAGLRESLTGIFEGIPEQWDRLTEAAEPLLELLGGSLRDTLSNLGDAFAGVRDSFGDTGPLLDQFAEIAGKLQPVLEALGIVLGAVIVAAITGLVFALEGLSKLLVAVLPAAADLLIGALESAGAAINLVLDTVINLVDLVSALVQGDWSAAWEAAKSLVGDFVDGVVGILSGLPATAGGIMLDLLGSVGGFLADLVADGAAKAGEFITGLASGFATWALSLPGEMGAMLASVSGFLADMVSDALTKGADFIAGLITGILGKIVELGQTVDGVKNGVLGKFSDALEWLVSAGGDILTGLWNGMSGLKDWVVEQATGLAGSIKDGITGAFKSAFGISSPSKLMAETVGRPIVQGIAVGMTEEESSLGATVDQIADAILDGLANASTEAVAAARNMGDAVLLEMRDRMDAARTELELARLAGVDQEQLDKLEYQYNLIRSAVAAHVNAIDMTVDEAFAAAEGRQASADYWAGILGSAEEILSGEAMGRVSEQLRGLQEQLALANLLGAPEEVTAGLQAAISAAEAQLVSFAEIQRQAIESGLISAWENIDLDAIAGRVGEVLDGSLVPKLQEKLDEINAVIAFGQAEGWSEELIAAYQEQADELADELAEAHEQTAIAAANGLLSDEALAAYEEAMGVIKQIPLDEIASILPQMEDGGAEIIDSLVDAIADGQLSVEDAFGMLSNASGEQIDVMIEQLRKLEEQLIVSLAEALIAGTDPSGIEANLAIITKLLDQLGTKADQTAKKVKGAMNPPAVSDGNGGNSPKKSMSGKDAVAESDRLDAIGEWVTIPGASKYGGDLAVWVPDDPSTLSESDLEFAYAMSLKYPEVYKKHAKFFAEYGKTKANPKGERPQLADGGIVPATPGGRDITVAEGGSAEAIIPLDSPRGRRLLGEQAELKTTPPITINQTINVMEASPAMIGHYAQMFTLDAAREMQMLLQEAN